MPEPQRHCIKRIPEGSIPWVPARKASTIIVGAKESRVTMNLGYPGSKRRALCLQSRLFHSLRFFPQTQDSIPIDARLRRRKIVRQIFLPSGQETSGSRNRHSFCCPSHSWCVSAWLDLMRIWSSLNGVHLVGTQKTRSSRSQPSGEFRMD